MRILQPLFILIVCTSCAGGHLKSQVRKGDICAENYGKEFRVSHPNSPAEWYSYELKPTGEDYLNSAKSTSKEAAHLQELMHGEAACYAEMTQLTGDTNTDALRTAMAKVIVDTHTSLDKYRNRKITRGEFFKEYTRIKSNLYAYGQELKAARAAKRQAAFDTIRAKLARTLKVAAGAYQESEQTRRGQIEHEAVYDDAYDDGYYRAKEEYSQDKNRNYMYRAQRDR